MSTHLERCLFPARECDCGGSALDTFPMTNITFHHGDLPCDHREAVTATLDALLVAMVHDPVWHTVTNLQRDAFLRLVRHAHPGEDTE